MKAACEAVLHAAVVGPVFALAGVLQMAARVIEAATSAAGWLAGEAPGPGAGMSELRMA